MKKKVKWRPIACVDVARYHVNYRDIELPILKDFGSEHQEKRLKALKDYMVYMSIARLFKSKSRKKILELLDDCKEEMNYDVKELSARFKGLYSRDSITKSYVSASKLLWLVNRRIIIMDSFCCKALAVSVDDYGVYRTLWIDKYNEMKNEVDSAIDEYQQICNNRVVSNRWFKKRVFDQYLWSIGR